MNNIANTFNIEFISKYNNWNIQYTYQVQFEYERFLELRNQDENLSPSDSIDLFWHTHILDTKFYYNYCMNKYKKIIHHNPIDSLNQEARKKRFETTILKYKEKFGDPVYLSVWDNYKQGFKSKQELKYISEHNSTKSNPTKINSEDNLDFVELSLKNKLDTDFEKIKTKQELPNYKENIITEPNTIKIFIFYTFADHEFSKFKSKYPDNLPFDKQIISIKVSDKTTLDDLINFISEKTGHNFMAIKLYPHPSWKKTLDTSEKVESRNNNNKSNFGLLNNFNPTGVLTYASNYLNVFTDPEIEKKKNNLVLKPGDNTFKFYIAELQELTSWGFC